MTIYEKLKIMIGVGDDKDSLLQLLVESAESEFLQHTNQPEVPVSAQNIILDMAIVKYNLIGTEGLSSQSYSGASESYAHYPSELKTAIRRYAKIKTL